MTTTTYIKATDIQPGDIIKGEVVKTATRKRTRRSANYPAGRTIVVLWVGENLAGTGPRTEYRFETSDQVLVTVAS